MAFNRPTLPSLIDRAEGDIKSGLGLTILLRRSFLKVIARAHAGLCHLMYGFFAFMEKQYFEDTAEGEYLIRKANIRGLSLNPATFAEFNATPVGLAGTVIPALTSFKRADGVLYSSIDEVILPGSIHLVADVAGKNSEVNTNDLLSIVSPIAGLDSNITVTTIITEPEDQESIESLRARLLNVMRNPFSGGTADDYLQWSKAVPGITRSWVNPMGLGPGTVVVYVVSDDEDPITPSPAKIQEVKDYIELYRPVTANVTVVAPELLPLDMVISIKPNTTAVQAAIRAELEDLILREATLAGSYKGPGQLNDGKLLISHINEAISLAIGEEDHLIESINGDVTPNDILPADGQLIVLGDITWQALA